MKTLQSIDSSDLRANMKMALATVRRTKKPLIVKQRNVPTAVLVDIDEYEDYLETHDPALLASITKARKEARSGALYSLEDVFGTIT